MTLEKIFETGNKWIKNNSKDKLFAIISESSSSRVICDIETTTILEFLELGSKNEVKIFIISKSIFNKDEITDQIALDELDASKIKEVETQLAKLKKFETKIDFLCFSYILNGVIYEYGTVANWVYEVDDIKTKIKEISEDERIKELRAKREKSLPKKTIKELSEALARNENFFRRRNDSDKLGTLLHDILEEKNLEEDDLGWHDKTLITNDAKSFFDRHLLKEKETDLVKQIAELKSQGITTKVAIRSKLDLTAGMLNKYFHK